MSQTGVPPLIQQAHEAFHRDLSRLLEERAGQCVAYCASERIGVAPTKAELYQNCLRQGRKRREFLVQHRAGVGRGRDRPGDS